MIKTRIISAIAAFLMLPAFSSCNYNSLVEQQQTVDQSWAEVQNQYQRRADLIPNLVNTVKGYASHESSTLEKVTEARAKATSINISAENLDEATLAKFQKGISRPQGQRKLPRPSGAARGHRKPRGHRPRPLHTGCSRLQHRHKKIPYGDLRRMVRLQSEAAVPGRRLRTVSTRS